MNLLLDVLAARVFSVVSLVADDVIDVLLDSVLKRLAWFVGKHVTRADHALDARRNVELLALDVNNLLALLGVVDLSTGEQIRQSKSLDYFQHFQVNFTCCRLIFLQLLVDSNTRTTAAS